MKTQQQKDNFVGIGICIYIFIMLGLMIITLVSIGEGYANDFYHILMFPSYIGLGMMAILPLVPMTLRIIIESERDFFGGLKNDNKKTY